MGRPFVFGDMMMVDGWDESAAAWINEIGEEGDFGRRFVLDAPVMELVRRGGFSRALDVGCGEGRFCRMLAGEGIATVGIDPTQALLDKARALHPTGEYHQGMAENLAFDDASFDLVVSYLSFIDIDDIDRAIAEMARVLAPGGALLVVNLNPYFTAASPDIGWLDTDKGRRYMIDRYMDERAEWVGWRGIRIQNWHRPMTRYMQLLIGQGLQLTHFDEPVPTGGPAEKADRYRRVPCFHVMEWRKPA